MGWLEVDLAAKVGMPIALMPIEHGLWAASR